MNLHREVTTYTGKGNIFEANKIIDSVVKNRWLFGYQLVVYGDKYYEIINNRELDNKSKTYSLVLSAKLLEKSLYDYPSSYTYEKLGIIYTYISMKDNYIYTKNFPEYKDQSRMDVLNRALNCLNTSSIIIPWRLTPKFLLADMYNQLGDSSNAIKWAQLVVNTPMKVWSEEGEEFKLNAQKMLQEYGVECNDPNLVVFDIEDRDTWNEGVW